MSRFYERYGHAIVWVLTSLLGITLLFWFATYLAAQGIFPEHVNGAILGIRNELVEMLVALTSLLHRNSHLVGAIATLGTFLIGLVNGILHARRHLPVRLMRFMDEQLAPVYQNSEALVAAVNVRSAHVPHRSPLYLKRTLDRALNGLAYPWAPRSKSSLDESVSEAEKYIDVTEQRLKRLKDVRDHALLLRGAVLSYDTTTSDDRAEKDFTSAVENPTTKAAALELRGLLRSRVGNLIGALEDFTQLEILANRVSDDRAKARALRLQAEIKMRQSAGTSMTPLNRAQMRLNTAKNLLDDGRTLVAEDRLELGQNRQAYGQLKEKMFTIKGGNDGNLAKQAYQEALKFYEDSCLEDAAAMAADIKTRLVKLGDTQQ